MPVLKLYPNGLTSGVAGPGATTPPARGKVLGWTAASVRRHTRWLYSVDTGRLTGYGYAVTLTIRDTPPSAADWQRLREAWLGWLRRRAMLRGHWVTEWQRRGAPHMHCALYFDRPLTATEQAMILAHWTALCVPYGASGRSQTIKPIDGPTGWLQYLSKHAARGVKHYQRAGRPAGWESTGRLWGKVGDWPVEIPLEVPLTSAEYHRYRRLVRSWRVANARAAQDWSRVRFARRMLRCTDPALSRVRGVSEWCPPDVAERLLDLVKDAS